MQLVVDSTVQKSCKIIADAIELPTDKVMLSMLLCLCLCSYMRTSAYVEASSLRVGAR